METPEAYIPIDRRQALAAGQSLPERSAGAALFADISGFTPLTEALVQALGPQRGAEELPYWLNQIYAALIAEIDQYGGTVIGFAGDAITCWFDQDNTGLRAATAALALQRAMAPFAAVSIPDAGTVALTIKVAVATGPVRRFLVGDPALQLIDVLAGSTLERLAAAEHLAQKSEVLLDPQASASLAPQLRASWRVSGTGERHAVLQKLAAPARPAPWTALVETGLSEEQVRPWLLPPVYERLRSGLGEFLTELRPATALFLRFRGIDYDADPRAGAKLDAYVRWVQAVLVRYGGFLIQLTTGDKGSYLYAAFGAPLAHGDDTARAAAAALELRALPPELDFIQGLQIGISHGRMRTGAYGGPTRRTYGVLGDEVNLAARLMQHAAPGEVLVSQAAQRAITTAFDWDPLPPLRVKGKAEPIAVFRLLAAGEQRGARLQEPRYSLPLVGRQAELALAEQLLLRTLDGAGQILGITAEAGMGKSRLVAEVIRLGRERNLPIYIGECQSYGTRQGYLVWHNVWRGLFGLDPTQPLEQQLAALEAALAAVDPALAGRLPLLGAVLNLPLEDNELTRSLDAKLRKSSLEALLVECLRARASRGPLQIVLEDCQWLDPLSQDLLEVVGRASAGLPLLLVLAYRPPEHERIDAPRVTQLPHCTLMPLGDFSPAESEQLIRLKLEQWLGEELSPPAALVERITARAQGNPFYIEELINYLQDRNIDPTDPQALEQIELPTSLQSLILSRIDQLNETQKLLIRVASVVGRVFRLSWLWGVHPELGAPEQVRGDLGELSRLDLTPLDQPEPESVYLFKHIMTREVAYESLPFATRAVLHGQLAGFIEQHYAGQLEQQLDLLAHHYWHSNDRPKKCEYLRRAGEAAQASYANAAAIDYFQRLLPLLPHPERPEVMLRLGQVLELVGRWDEAMQLYTDGVAPAEQYANPVAQARCQLALGDLLRKRGSYEQAADWLAQARANFERLEDQSGLAEALKLLGSVPLWQRDFPAARALFNESLAIWEALGDQAGVASTINNLGLIAQYEGNLALASSLYEQALAIWRGLGHKYLTAVVLNNLGLVSMWQGDFERAAACYHESLALQREIGNRYGIALALGNLGEMAHLNGDHDAARGLYEQNLAIFRELGERWSIANMLSNLGYLCFTQGDLSTARRLHEEALAIRRTLDDKLSIVNSLNHLACVVRDQGDSAVAHRLFSEGLVLCRALGPGRELAYLLEDFAVFWSMAGDAERALRLAGAATAIRETSGAALSDSERTELERRLEPAQAALGPQEASAAWDLGRSLPLDELIEEALVFQEQA